MATIITRSGKGSPLTHDEVDANFTNLNTDKLEISGGTMTGDLILNADPISSLQAATKSYVDVTAANNSAINGTAERNVYTATSGQTTFNVNYDVGYVDVYMNGVKLVVGTDFTATSGTSIVLTTGATSGDIVDIIAYGTFLISDTYSKSESDARYLQSSGDLDLSGSDITGIGNISLAGNVGFANWTITESGGSLYFATGGTNKMKLDASGNLDVVGNVNTNATIS